MNETEININWFKKIFLGFLGSIALSKALYSYNDILPFGNLDVNAPINWGELSTLFVWLIALIYFIANLIRYYMSSFIYNAHSDETNLSPKEMFENELKDITYEVKQDLKTKIENKLTEESETKKTSRIINLTIIDLIIYALSIFAFGLAAMNMCKPDPINFYWLLFLIVTIDLFHLFFQNIFYYKKYNSKQKLITRCMREVLAKEINDMENDLSKSNDVTSLHKYLEHHQTSDTLLTVKKALKIWIWVDIFELVIIGSGIFLQTQFPDSSILWLLLIIASLLVIFYNDVRKNKKSWAKLFGINS